MNVALFIAYETNEAVEEEQENIDTVDSIDGDYAEAGNEVARGLMESQSEYENLGEEAEGAMEDMQREFEEYMRHLEEDM